MKISIRFVGLNAKRSWLQVIAAQLNKLESLRAIDSAQVRLEFGHRSTPPFRVMAQLEISGPDLHAEARDHAWEAAFLKVIHELERQIHSRQTRRSERWKTNLQLGRGPGRAVCLASGRV